MKLYDQFIERTREIGMLRAIGGTLGWDMKTQMPPKGAEARGEQMALLSGLIHEMATCPELGDALKKLSEADGLNPDQAANVREMSRMYDRAAKLPKSLIEEKTRARAEGQTIWKDARPKNDFAAFAPCLKRNVKLQRETAELLGYDDNPYDALLDAYEPNATNASTNAMFDPIRKEAKPLLDAILGSSVRPDESLLTRPLSPRKQRRFGILAAKEIGFDFEAGRLDVSAHPFCSGSHPNDVRMTTRYDVNYPLSSFFAVLHEAGHGLYGQGLLTEHIYTPRGRSVSLGVHESQSRFWENSVGRSRPFWKRYLPKLKKAYGGAFDDVSLDDFYFAVNRATPGFIRVEADEITYNFHILLRFELENEMINGRIEVDNLPSAWNEKMRGYLGIDPPNDAMGVMQDIHWAFGGIGYFPTYTLGNLYAAQLLWKIRQDIPDLDDEIERGNFAGILEWLRERIHRQGMLYSSAELIKRATGEPPNGSYFVHYLREKYGSLYRLSLS